MAAISNSLAGAFGDIFGDRHIVVRSEGGTRQIHLRRRHQCIAAALLAGVALWAVAASIGCLLAGVWLADQANLIAGLKIGYAQSITAVRHGTVAPLEKALAAATEERAGQDRQIATLAEAVEGAQAANLDLETKVASLRQRLILAWHQGVDLQDRLRQARLGAAALSTAHEALEDEQGDLFDHIGRLQNRLAALQDTQEQILSWLRERSTAYVTAVEQGLSFTGLDLEALIGQLRDETAPGRGGPLIPVLPGEPIEEGDGAGVAELVPIVGRAFDLHDLASQMPLGRPLRDPHSLTSGFGTRRDPFTRRKSHHFGLDFAAPRRTPVYAAAPGEVVRAGPEGTFGNVVEIEHGLGFSTLYAHLDAIKVRVGQQLGPGGLVGLLGNTGRSSGPHLHYEVHYNGEPVDPLNFLKAGERILKAAEREAAE